MWKSSIQWNMQTNKKYSFNTLAGAISSFDFEDEEIDLGKETIIFTDADVNLKGKIKGYFNVQKQTYEDPPFCDLVDVYVEINSVHISGDNYEKTFSFEEQCKLEEMIKKIMI